MDISLTSKEFRRLLDLVYIGNWVLNSTRGEDRFEDYDHLSSKLLSYCLQHDMTALAEFDKGRFVPSKAFVEGGIHEAIADYEDAIFYDLLAEELARRDLGYPEINDSNLNDILEKKEDYLNELEANGLDRIQFSNESD